jgi:diguanylate cyclase (GGDEF)-like protein/PAS domain S-box-containing protein
VALTADALPDRTRFWFAGSRISPASLVRSRLWATVAVVCVVALSEAVMHLHPGGSRLAVDFDNIAELTAAWLAAGSCLWASRRVERRLRRFWTLAAASTFAWGAGQGVWTYYEVGLGGQVPSPSLADIGFLSAVPLMVATLLAFPVARLQRFARPVMVLDGALVATSTLFVSWALVLGPIYRSHQGSGFAQTVTLAYPAGDALIVVVVLSVAARATRSAWITLGFVGGGVLAVAFSDSAFAYLSQAGQYGLGLNVDIGWIAGFLLIALTPIWTGETSERIAEVGRPSRIGVLVPYVPLAGALTVATVFVFSGRALGSFLVATGIVMAVIVAARQLLALLDSVSLGNRQAARFAALVQGSSDLTTIVSENAAIVYQSPSSLTILGRPHAQLNGHPFHELVHPDEAPAFLRMLGGVITQPGGEATGEWRLRHQDGQYVDVESRLANRLDDPSVCGITINSRDIGERKLLEEDLRFQAVHDQLTGLPNRTLLNDRLERALALHARDADHCDIAVLFIDLDDFKNVNDGIGHAAGDELLKEVARRLEHATRSTDTVARTGGDEFAIILDSTFSAADTDVAVERILEIFNRPFLLGGREHINHASVGIAVSNSESSDAAALFQKAELAMHVAKASGKGRTEIYKPGMHELLVDQLQLEADMRDAVGREELAVVYQPIVDLGAGTINGVEALMRWIHPTRGLLAPTTFIPTAEASGLIIPMGRWLLREACRDLRSWDRLSATRLLRLSVNLSARQLDDPDLVTDIVAALAEAGVEASRLTLEITETVLLRDFDAAMTTLTQLKQLGVELSIDDFGTGYSSLSYLHQLPVNEIKIDRSFVTAMTESSEGAGLVRTIVQLAGDLNLRTVAEGVETQEQLDELRSTDCELVQGYLFDPPLTEHQIRERLKHGALAWATSPRMDGART